MQPIHLGNLFEHTNVESLQANANIKQPKGK